MAAAPAPTQGGLQHRAEELAATLPPLLVAAERVAATVAQGVHGRRRVGQGDSFWQFRQYEAGDAAQRIDWRESAKSERLYVRETEWEAAQTVWLWRDASASMTWSSGRGIPTKRARADLLLLALAALLVRGGERVALLGGGMSPASGRVALTRLATLLDGHGDKTAPSLPQFEALPRHASLVLFGDFLEPLDEIAAALGRFAGLGLRGHVVQVLDPAEETLPFAGRVRFEGVEAAEEVLVSRVEGIREQYVARLEAQRAGLAEIARRAGWSFAPCRTDRPPTAALLGLYTALAAPRGL